MTIKNYEIAEEAELIDTNNLARFSYEIHISFARGRTKY